MSGLDFDDFLNHSQRQSGGGFLSNWKEDGSIIVWLHPTAKIHALWSHRWFRLDTGDKDNPLSEFKPLRFNCMEEEGVLKRQRFRHADGTREVPPVICPHCLMLEWVRGEIAAKRLSWTDPVFKFEAGDDEIIIHAGGLTNMFGKKNPSDKEKLELKRAGIKLSEAYMESGLANLRYVLRVIANSSPEDGAQIAMETPALGDKLKKCIKDRMEDLGREEGDPRINPYAFKWTFDDNQEFSNKYDCRVSSKTQLSDEVRKAMEEPPPDVDNIVSMSNLAQHRLSLEQYALIDMPFDEFFAPAEALHGKIQAQVPGDSESEDDEEEAPKAKTKGKKRQDDEEEDDLPASWSGRPSSEAKSDVEQVPCEHCHKEFPADVLTCPHCGAEYDEDGNLTKVPEAKKPAARRGRAAK